VDPNEKLRLEANFKINDLTQWRTERVIGWKPQTRLSRAGNLVEMVKVVTTERSFVFWVQTEWEKLKSPKAKDLYEKYFKLDFGGPETITFRKVNNFFEVKEFNLEAP